jgi:hypothetical protein
MKLHKLAALTIAIGLVALAIHVAFEFEPIRLAFGDHGVLYAANAALLAMRTEHAGLVTRAAAKIAEVTATMTPEQIAAIERDHADLVRQAGELQTRIDVEAAKPENQQHAWLPADITRIQSRAAAFGLTPTDALAVISDPTIRTMEAATDKLQDILVKRAPPRQDPHARITQDEGDTLRRSIESSILLRANPQALPANAPEREMARNYRGMRLLEVGRLFFEEAHGVKLRGLGTLELAGALLGMTQVRAAGMHSTSDFANLLANIATKRLRDAYGLAPQTFKAFSRQSNNPDFKAKSVVQLSAAPAFKLVREGQEYSYGGLTDGKEQYALATFGRIIAITRQALINDDLGAFDRLPMMYGRAAADLESNVVYNILLDNAAMSDTVALFHATHANLMSASAIDETNLGLADKAIREQRGFAAKSADREYLNLMPKFVLTGTAKRIEAQKMITAVTPNATSGVNVFQNALEPITEQRITGNKWFLIADPATIDTIEYAYLDGEEGVFTEQRQGFNVDGIEVKARLDFAAKAIDWRGMVYNPGA